MTGWASPPGPTTLHPGPNPHPTPSTSPPRPPRAGPAEPSGTTATARGINSVNLTRWSARLPGTQRRTAAANKAANPPSAKSGAGGGAGAGGGGGGGGGAGTGPGAVPAARGEQACPGAPALAEQLAALSVHAVLAHVPAP